MLCICKQNIRAYIKSKLCLFGCVVLFMAYLRSGFSFTLVYLVYLPVTTFKATFEGA